VAITTPAWVRDAVFYQVFPDRFAPSERVAKPGRLEDWDAPPTAEGFKGGDLLGIAERLDYLADLGVTALYLNPIFVSASNHRYHTDDYLAVDPLLGRDEALRQLLDACHGRGMRVVLDGVFNHCGRGFWPFHHVAETGAASPYRDWFYLDKAVLRGERQLLAYPGEAELRGLVGGPWDEERHVRSRSQRVLGYRAWWDLPALPKLNVGNPPTREYLLGVAEHWLRFGIDGWRLDVPEEIADVAFWREFRRRVKTVDPDAYIVAEIWHVAPERLAGDQFDATMNYPLAEAILGFAAGSHLDRAVVASHHTYAQEVRPLRATAFARRLEGLLSIHDPAVTAVQLNLLGSHDLPRFVTMCGGDRASLRLATLIQMTLPGAPCLYYGDEIGLEGGMNPGCRGAFPWDPSRWDADLRDFVRGAIALRHAHPVLRHGAFRAVAAQGMSIAYARSRGDEWILVAVNAGERPSRLELSVPEAAGRTVEAVSWPGWEAPARWRPAVVTADSITVELAARDGLVLRATR